MAASEDKVEEKPVLPISKRTADGEHGWWIDASELTADVPDWGSYPTRREAEDDRRGFVARVRAERRRANRAQRTETHAEAQSTQRGKRTEVNLELFG